MEAYTYSKAQILIHQTAEDTAVLGRDDPIAWSLKDFVRGELITFGKDFVSLTHSGVYLENGMISYWNGDHPREIFSRDVISLRGDHNLMNVLAACAIAIAAGLPIEGLQNGVKSFTGVEHRLEYVRSWGGADWYNDSIATAPERAVAAVQSFDEPTVLLAGGRDKDLPWTEWATQVGKHVDHLILFGEAQEKIWEAINITTTPDRSFSVDRCKCMKDALERTLEVIKPGDVVLLSPGGTSFDEFRDFSERGDWFKQWVNNLP
jgi:UDP-N-acetylmuramoylalanine--D-glutamate ligase